MQDFAAMSDRASLLQADNYVDAVVNSDISRVDNISRNAGFAHRLLRSYSRYQGAQVSLTKIEDLGCKDWYGEDESPFFHDGPLDIIAARCGYDLKNHHHALADAEACAWIAREIL